MTSTREELLASLGDLQALSRNKKHQLARPEHEEAVRVLSALCAIDGQAFDAVVQALPDFPADTGADALAGSWESIGTPPDRVCGVLATSSFATDRGKRLRLVLGRHLALAHPDECVAAFAE